MDDLETKIKEQLLDSLIEHMSDKMGEDPRLGKHKAMEVSVAAPDKEGLAAGLEHAQSLAEKAPEEGGEGSDEERLMDLLGSDDGDKEDDKDEDDIPMSGIFHR